MRVVRACDHRVGMAQGEQRVRCTGGPTLGLPPESRWEVAAFIASVYWVSFAITWHCGLAWVLLYPCCQQYCWPEYPTPLLRGVGFGRVGAGAA